MEEVQHTLAYVFWHWKQSDVAVEAYEQRQQAFHTALVANPAPGFRGSFSSALTGMPWAAAGGEAYEDWYLVDSFAALGELNQAAVSAQRSAPHDAAAAIAADGSGGLYRLRLGSVGAPPHCAHWFSKPPGVSYQALLATLAPFVENNHAQLWMRQMVLGPGQEFCLHAQLPLELPADVQVFVVPLRPVWP